MRKKLHPKAIDFGYYVIMDEGQPKGRMMEYTITHETNRSAADIQILSDGIIENAMPLIKTPFSTFCIRT